MVASPFAVLFKHPSQISNMHMRKKLAKLTSFTGCPLESQFQCLLTGVNLNDSFLFIKEESALNQSNKLKSFFIWCVLFNRKNMAKATLVKIDVSFNFK